MIIVPKFAIKDRASTWDVRMVMPPPFDVEAYQKQLNSITGFTTQGEPVLRLVWAGNLTITKAVEFDRWRNPIRWERKPRYAIPSRDPLTLGQPVPLRRWIIEMNTDVEQISATGGKHGKTIIPDEKGFYTPFIAIADHSKCPADCPASEWKCFGDYKQPDNAELDWIRQAQRQLEVDANATDPRKAVTVGDVRKFRASVEPTAEEIAAKEIEEQVANEEKNRQFVKDWMNTHVKTQTFVDYGKK